MEEWKTIKDFENYEISSTGKVRRNGKILKSQKNIKSGLMQQMLYKNGKGYLKSVHKLVAEHFLSPPDDETLVVRHISTDITDNDVSNLHYAKNGNVNNFNIKYTYKYYIRKITPEGDVIKTYTNWDAVEKDGYKRVTVMACANKRYFKDIYKKFRWSYEKIKIKF